MQFYKTNLPLLINSALDKKKTWETIYAYYI